MDVKKLTFPLSKDSIAAFNAGQMVSINGEIITCSEGCHRFLFNERPLEDDMPFNLGGAALYHSTPIIKKSNGQHRALSFGPSTSARVELYEPFIIERYGISAIIGKGGMGTKTLDALREAGCLYLHAIGGAGAYLADRIKKISAGWMAGEFENSETMWVVEVEDFPAIVTMDSTGRSLHEDVRAGSYNAFMKLLRGQK
jgi:fumarate hydratase class I